MTTKELFAFIQEHKLAVLSSVNSKGAPESALVGIAVTQELEIIFDTVRTSRKYANLIGNNKTAFVVGTTSEKTLQFEGEASELTRGTFKSYKAVYFAAWPDGPARENWPTISYFVVKPKWIRYSDYGETPAFVQEFLF